MRLENDLSYKVYDEYEVSHIAQRLRELDDLVWNLDVSRQAYGHGPHGKTNSIILNYCRGEPEVDKKLALELKPQSEGWAAQSTDKQNLWQHRFYEEFKQDIQNIKSINVDDQLTAYTNRIVKELETKFQGVAGLVLYVRLPAGTVIEKHRDNGYYLGAIHRLHIPIITNDSVEFNLENMPGSAVSINMKTGVLYEINNQHYHGVKNLGSTDRIHLIIDIIPHSEFK